MGKDTKESGDKYSLRGKVYDRIREDILNGVYKEHFLKIFLYKRAIFQYHGT